MTFPAVGMIVFAKGNHVPITKERTAQRSTVTPLCALVDGSPVIAAIGFSMLLAWGGMQWDG